jgi:hypothetical protein
MAMGNSYAIYKRRNEKYFNSIFPYNGKDKVVPVLIHYPHHEEICCA